MGKPCHNYDLNIILELLYNISACPWLQLAFAPGLSVYLQGLPCTHVLFTQNRHRPLSHRGYVFIQVLCPVCSSHTLDPVGACGVLSPLPPSWIRACLRVGVASLPCSANVACRSSPYRLVTTSPVHPSTLLPTSFGCLFACALVVSWRLELLARPVRASLLQLPHLTSLHFISTLSTFSGLGSSLSLLEFQPDCCVSRGFAIDGGRVHLDATLGCTAAPFVH
eukprot:2912547-Amphidinium_carterae.2